VSQDDLYRGDPPPAYAPPPGWAPPAYGPPGHGPAPGYGPPPGYGWRPPTNQLAVVALVLTFVFPPAGLVCGIVARQQLHRTGEGGDGLTLAAIIIGGISTTLVVVGLLLWISVLASIGNGAFSP
jgi:hypothetical protein